MSSIPSFLRESFDFLDKLRSVGRFEDNVLLVTIDVVGLYPSIPHDDGINALSDFLDSHHYDRSVRDSICELAGLVLKRNIFEFNEQLYLQQSGTAFGTKMAPNFSNIFMHELEQKFFWLMFRTNHPFGGVLSMIYLHCGHGV